MLESGLLIGVLFLLNGCGGANTEVVGFNPRHTSPSIDGNRPVTDNYPAPTSHSNAGTPSEPPRPDSSGGVTAALPDPLANSPYALGNGGGNAALGAVSADLLLPITAEIASADRSSRPIVLPTVASATATPCAGRDSRIEVVTATHRLFLCDHGRSEGSFHVAFGLGGFYKHEDGDGRTPIGLYPLYPPEASDLAHLFIPIGYPNAADLAYDEAHGISNPGGDVGIHGPVLSLLPENPKLWPRDWTDGCIGLSTDADIERIGEWVTRHPGATIRIEPP